MTKGIVEIEAALRERYSGATYEKGGNTYAAWEDIVYAANAIFGPLGWSRVFVETPHREGEGYACILRGEFFFIDLDGERRSVVMEAPGFNELSTTQSGQEMTDTAFKGAYADALKKLLQPLGDAFALYIGAEAKAAKAAGRSGYTQQRTTTTSTPRQQTGGTDRRPSDKQVYHLKKSGLSEDQIASMPFGEWKEHLDNYFAAKDNKPVLAAVKTPADFGGDDEDDF